MSHIKEYAAMTKGYLQLENGAVFEGIVSGAQKYIEGEVVFTTGMVGYPEGYTDPSFCRQILVHTYPLIGNYGVPAQTTEKNLSQFLESNRIHIAGLVVSSLMEQRNHWQAAESLSSWLTRESIPILQNIDTRTVTKMLRSEGVLKGAITTQPPKQPGVFSDINKENLVAQVSCREPIVYGKGPIHILLFDCGVKFNQIRMLQMLNTTVTRVPWDFDPFGEKNIPIDGIIISNGPGDPKKVEKTIQTIRVALEKRIPILGICLGNQVLALAAGANTYKLKYGHRGQNQPVIDEITGRCYVTTQNHGFAVDEKSIPSDWVSWFRNLNDGTNEGIRHTKLPFCSVQFHPEACPGPTDTGWIFQYFIDEIKRWQKK